MSPSLLSASDIHDPLITGVAAPPVAASFGRPGASSPRTLHPSMGLPADRRTQSGSTVSDEKLTMPVDPEHGFNAASQDQGRAVGFWDHSMYRVRGHVFRLWARTVLIIFVFILCILSMYWAVLFRLDHNLRGLKVAVVDFDGQVAPYNKGGVQPFVGPMVTQVAKKQYNAVKQTSVGYTVVPPAQYHNDPLEVRRSVYEFDAWAAIIVNANASALLQGAIDSGNSSYDPMGAIQVVVLTAKDETTYYSHIIPQLEAFQRQFMTEFSQAWMERLASNYTLTPATLARAPAAVNPGIGFLQVDLRPFQPATATPAMSVGLIYLIIVAFFSFSFFLPIHEGHPPLHFWQFIIWRLVASVGSYFFVSLAYSLVSLAFLFPFWRDPGSAVEVAIGATAYGHGSFVVYWMLNFIGMIALGIACENVAMVIGQPWTALWLIFWVITNVATAFYSIELAPAFFRWGYAWPLHNIVEASRHILFDLHSRLGLNFGVLIVWCVVNATLFPFCCYFMRWKTEREKRLAEKNKDRYAVITDGKKRVLPKKEGDQPPIRKRGFLRGM